jgi:hypothetical protein
MGATLRRAASQGVVSKDLFTFSQPQKLSPEPSISPGCREFFSRVAKATPG